MNTILIKDVLLNGVRTNILIKGNRFESINADASTVADRVIEGEGYAILPPFFNTHTHAAMSLLRGYADDMELDTWLHKHIWPAEGKLTSHDIYRGTKFCILEMIKAGTAFFSDMYFSFNYVVKAAAEMGIRAAIGITMMDSFSDRDKDEGFAMLRDWQDPTDGLLTATIAPHAIYTVGPELLVRCADAAAAAHAKLHIHLSETWKEVRDCINEHGTTPVRYLDQLGILGPNVIAAHCVHLDAEEWKILADKGVTIAHCPASNMKLASGRIGYENAIASGVRMTLGTDGDASNNNQDMREEMKLATMAAKMTGDPTLLSADQVLEWATRNGAEAFGINSAEITPGKLADAILVDLNNERMQPLHNLTSNWVYSADSSCIDTLICDGRIIMEHRHVDNEEEIIDSIKIKR